jgi:hypothetical protein
MRQAGLHLIFAGLKGGRALPAHGMTTSHDRASHDHCPTPKTPCSGAAPRSTETMLTFLMTHQQWQTVRRNDIHLAGIGPIREFVGIPT